MADETENEGALQKRTAQDYLTYAKWGLMGIGGLWVANVVIGAVLSPLGLVGIAGAGAAGVWYFNRSRSPEEAPKSDAAGLRAEAERQAEEELAAAGVPRAEPDSVSEAGPPAKTAVEQFDRLADELERMKSQMSDD